MRAWYVEDPGAAGVERRLPTGATQVVVNLAADRLSWADPLSGVRHEAGGIGVVRPHGRAVELDRAEQRRSVGLVLPVGASVDLPPARELRERLLHAADPRAVLTAAVRPRLAYDPGLRWAATQLWDGRPVAEVVDASGLSASTFGRRFRAGVGLAPKRWQRIGRLQRVLAALPSRGWAEVAAACGYADQPHLVRDFTELTGFSPARYAGAGPAARNHVTVSFNTQPARSAMMRAWHSHPSARTCATRTATPPPSG